MRLIDADALLTERKKSKYYHLPNGDIAIPIIDVEHAPTVQPDHTADIGKKAASISCGHENDVIFRKAAIDALARMMPRSYTPDGSHPADEEIFRAQEVFADCIEALEILPSAQSEQRWIPCSERMPVEGQKCLVYDKAIGFRVDTYIGHGNPFNWELFVRDYEAWMPLPEPYRGGDEE